jgi:predicted amidohydrolase YtcJ
MLAFATSRGSKGRIYIITFVTHATMFGGGLLWSSPIYGRHVTADLIIRHAQVYTVDPRGTIAQAVAVAGDRIVYVGPDRGLRPYIGKHTRVLDQSGKTVLPGFIDSHLHPVSGGMLLSQCGLHDYKTQEEILHAIAACAKESPEKPWITGSGWDLHIFRDNGPARELLDRVVPDRPAVFEAMDGHSVWVNSKALEIAGVTAATPDPANGRIERNPTTGEPSGTLRERAAGLVTHYVPEPSGADYAAGLRSALRMANSYGLTSLLDARASPAILRTYADAESSGWLTARIVAAQVFDPSREIDRQIAAFQDARDRWNSKWFSCNEVKLFVDGVLESHTAALLEPYLGTSQLGDPNYTSERLNTIVTALDKSHFDLHFHAIGDRAIRMSLDAIEAAQRINGARDSRHQIAHLELVDPQDVARFAALGVTANFEALWAYPDEDVTKLTFPVLGPARSRWLYPIASIRATGARIVGGSDWSVTSMNPLEAIQVALTRRSLDSSGDALNPDEAVDLATMLAAYTINGALVRRQENSIGSIEIGKLADLVVLDADLLATRPKNIHRIRVERTFVGGQEVYSLKGKTAR